ncbi:MAG: S26 family signal peptidase [Candidatus Aenigmarchaeota archaeon]|nr:S26 family signal peptidase [Candidatus Aenigmarchaeota archaeon]
MRYLPLALVIFTLGCVSPVQNNEIPYQLNDTFAQEFEELVTNWNAVAGMQLATTQEGFKVYFDKNLSVVNISCTNKMSPTFDCNDVLLEYMPTETALKAGDVVSFEISASEAQIFAEEPFEGTRIIQRRIFRIGDDDGIYFIMKRDAAETTHKIQVRFDRIKGRVIGFIFDARVEKTALVPYTLQSRGVGNYNDLTDKWNTFVSTVYEGSINGTYKLFYDRTFDVPSLACTGSMRPTLDCNDLVLSHKPQHESEIQKGDVISFRIAPNETAGFLEPPSTETIHVMHRIFRITTTQNRTAFITKGDNPETNAQTDAIHLDFGRVETKVIAYFKESFGATFEDN